MKYMLMMNTPGGGPYQIASWPAEDLKAHIAFMMRFGNKLSAAGELVGAEGLSGPDQAKLVEQVPMANRSPTASFRSRRNSWRAIGSWTSTLRSGRTPSPPRHRRPRAPAASR